MAIGSRGYLHRVNSRCVKLNINLMSVVITGIGGPVPIYGIRIYFEPSVTSSTIGIGGLPTSQWINSTSTPLSIKIISIRESKPSIIVFCCWTFTSNYSYFISPLEPINTRCVYLNLGSNDSIARCIETVNSIEKISSSRKSYLTRFNRPVRVDF